MYEIELTDFGFKVIFSGHLAPEQAQGYKDELARILPSLPEKFGILVDMRELKPLGPESQAIITSSQGLVAERLTRSATVVNSTILFMQFRRLSKASHVIDSKRFVDASKTSDWEWVARKWIVEEIDPYLEEATT
ncbi:MAG: hypothetical protein R8G66_11050 [Cytophagales bacterium]|nr:hypothetical protein [Cytophagales bacterium]